MRWRVSCPAKRELIGAGVRFMGFVKVHHVPSRIGKPLVYLGFQARGSPRLLPFETFDGGGGGIRTPVRNGFGRTSTRVVNLWSRGRYADSRAYPSASVRLYESQTRERSAPGQVLLDEASPPSRRPRVGRWPSVRPPGRNRCSQLLFSLFFNEANRGPRRAIRSPRIPSKPNHPQWGNADSIPQIPRAVWKNRQGRIYLTIRK